jgi:hypothetical protein
MNKFLILISMAGLVACSNHSTISGTGTKTSQATAAEASNSDSGTCGSQVLEDLTDVKLSCALIVNYSFADMKASHKDETVQCKSLAKSLIQKYPNMNCSYVAVTSDSVESKPTTETSAQYQRLVDQLDQAGI